MKTLIFTFAILFSFSFASAQEAINNTNATAEVNSTILNEDSQASKAAYYNALIVQNDLDISLTENKKVSATSTKAGYYEALINANDFNVNINSYAKSKYKDVNTEQMIKKSIDQVLYSMP